MNRRKKSDNIPTPTSSSMNEDLWANILHALPFPVWQADRSGRIYFLNPLGRSKYETARGYEGVYLWEHLVHSEDRMRLRVEWERTVERKRPFVIACRYARGNSEFSWVLICCGPVQIPGILTERFVGTFREIGPGFGETLELGMSAISPAPNLFTLAAAYVDAPSFRYSIVNSEYAEFYGHKKSEIIGKKVGQVVGVSRLRAAIPHLRELGRGRPVRFEQLYSDKNGKKSTVEVNIIPLFDPLGRISGCILFERRMGSDDGKKSSSPEHRERLKRFVDASSDAIVFLNRGKIFDWNKAMADLVGHRKRSIEGKKLSHFIAPDSVEAFKVHVKREKNRWFESGIIHSSGVVVSVEIISKAINGYGKTRHVTIIRDLTERKRNEERLRYLAHYDKLTQLPNRSLFTDRLEMELARAERAGKKLVIMFMDIDRFKTVNDSLGHHTGDELLKIIGSRLVLAVRETDTVARLGGDEFVILLPDVDNIHDVASVAEKIGRTVAEPFTIDGQILSVSIGVAIHPEDGNSSEEMVRNADAAMYLAKDRGRGNYQFFKSHLNTVALEALNIESGLRAALVRGELKLVYQPQIRMDSKQIVGFEALLRWDHPDRGLLEPAHFIPIAEQRGLIDKIGDWVLQEACRQSREWIDQGLSTVPVAVNVSPTQFSNSYLIDRIKVLLTSFDLDGSALVLEVTESAIMEDLPHKTRAIQEIRDLGIQVVIDDFGTGYSLLSYLRKFKVDKLKIDKSFVRDIPANSDDKAITTAIIQMAKSLKLGVVAEGVETNDQFSFLRDNECEEMQGYFFSLPLDAWEVPRILSRENVEKLSGRV